MGGLAQLPPPTLGTTGLNRRSNVVANPNSNTAGGGQRRQVFVSESGAGPTDNMGRRVSIGGSGSAVGFAGSPEGGKFATWEVFKSSEAAVSQKLAVMRCVSGNSLKSFTHCWIRSMPPVPTGLSPLSP